MSLGTSTCCSALLPITSTKTLTRKKKASWQRCRSIIVLSKRTKPRTSRSICRSICKNMALRADEVRGLRARGNFAFGEGTAGRQMKVAGPKWKPPPFAGRTRTRDAISGGVNHSYCGRLGVERQNAKETSFRCPSKPHLDQTD